MEAYYAVVNTVRVGMLAVGSLVIFIGIGRAVLEAPRGVSGRLVARRLLPHVALGLEFFIGATILNLILNPTWTAVATTALTMVTRKLITLSFNSMTQER
jgi:uncharacterized membrane protein